MQVIFCSALVVSMIFIGGCSDNVEVNNKAEDVKEFAELQNDIVDHDWSIGDYVKFGSYYDEPIMWSLIAIEDGKPLLLSDNILSLKAFSSTGDIVNPAGSRINNDVNSNITYKNAYGTNLWEESSLRWWLNSIDTEKVFKDYKYNEPSDKWVFRNSYHKKGGFLSGFSEEELALIRTRKNKVVLPSVHSINEAVKGGTIDYEFQAGSIKNALSNYKDAFYNTTEDKVFLLSIQELYEYVFSNSLDIESYPNEMAVKNSSYNDKLLTESNVWGYWTRTPDSANNYSVVSVSASQTFDSNKAYNSLLGVRPAIMLYEDVSMFSGEGTVDNPYRIPIEEEIIIPREKVTINLLDGYSVEIYEPSDDWYIIDPGALEIFKAYTYGDNMDNRIVLESYYLPKEDLTIDNIIQRESRVFASNDNDLVTAYEYAEEGAIYEYKAVTDTPRYYVENYIFTIDDNVYSLHVHVEKEDFYYEDIKNDFKEIIKSAKIINNLY